MSYAVSPKLDCPHVPLCRALDEELGLPLFKDWLIEQGTSYIHNPACSSPGCSGYETWICLVCRRQLCSRYEEGHMADHYESMPMVNEKMSHSLAFSFSDGSFWCYDCDSYVYSPELREIARTFSDLKFPNGEGAPANNTNSSVFNPVFGTIASALPPRTPPITFDKLIEKLQKKEFQNVAVLTGAGISVAAGIPDFRTPGIGLYSRVAELNLPELERPEDIFRLELFKNNPYPFMKIAKEALLAPDVKPHPVNAHHFIKQLHNSKQLLLNYTQNIDGLELEAGLPLEKLVQAHGHMRSAHCWRCKASHSMDEFMEACMKYEPLLCTVCNRTDGDNEDSDDSNDGDQPATRGYVKPDIVFFGESLPHDFHENFARIDEADLIIVMGTSLKVYPFAFLVQATPSSVPIVVINRDNPGFDPSRILFLPGEIEDNVKLIMEALGWPTV